MQKASLGEKIRALPPGWNPGATGGLDWPNAMVEAGWAGCETVLGDYPRRSASTV
jgi:hypothetical protein